MLLDWRGSDIMSEPVPVYAEGTIANELMANELMPDELMADELMPDGHMANGSIADGACTDRDAVSLARTTAAKRGESSRFAL